MPFLEIKPESMAIMKAMAGERADSYISEVLLPSLQEGACAPDQSVQSLREALLDPYRCLACIFAVYAFARRGKDRVKVSEIAIEALSRTADQEDFEAFLKLPDASSLWRTFVQVCEEHRHKPMEQLNRGIIAGLAELAQEIYRDDGVGSIAGWLVNAVIQTDRLEPEFLRMVDIRGVGPKMTSVFMRDIVFLFDLEDRLENIDRLHVQPVDKWLRLIARHVVDEPDVDHAADWVLVGKISKYTRKAGLSGIRFNMGTTWFGSREVKQAELFDGAIRDLLDDLLVADAPPPGHPE